MTVNIKKIDEKIVKLFSSMFFALGKVAWIKFSKKNLRRTVTHNSSANTWRKGKHYLAMSLFADLRSHGQT